MVVDLPRDPVDGPLEGIGMRGLRILGALAMAIAIAHCGDNNVHVSTDVGVIPSPGTFTGFLSDGASIRMQVGSIEEVAFDCDGASIQETFTPPKPIDSDGTFDVKFDDGGRTFRIRGTFRDNDNVAGTIDDEDNACDTSYEAARSGRPTTTPTTTPTGKLPTPTPTETPTTDITPTEVTPTPTGATMTPTATPSVPPCPVAVEVVGNAGAKKVLDSGWTGLGHNATVVSDGKLTFNVACSGTTRPCGVCNVSGPIQNVKADQGDINPRRCSNDSSTKCTDNSACTGGGTCIFYFGAPLPLAAGGIGSCVLNQVNGSASGTTNIESGAFATTLNLTSRVALSSVDSPCPKCVGDNASNDGQANGHCVGEGSPRNGMPCDVNGTSPIPSFGSTSLDCPPASLVTSIAINLDGSSGTETMTLTATSPACTGPGAEGKLCFCPAAGSVGAKPNACIDAFDTPDVDESLCLPIAPGSNKGSCQDQPVVDQYCSPTETFRGCSSNNDCTAPGDVCKPIDLPCFLDNGIVGGSVTALGKASPPNSSGVSNPTFAALFCIPPVVQTAINTAAGLPGLGRIELPLTSKQILSLP